jgi:hypothetical protein
MAGLALLVLVVAFVGQCGYLAFHSFACLLRLARTGAIREALSQREYRRAEAPGKFRFLVAYHLVVALALGAALAWMVIYFGAAVVRGLRS